MPSDCDLFLYTDFSLLSVPGSSLAPWFLQASGFPTCPLQPSCLATSMGRTSACLCVCPHPVESPSFLSFPLEAGFPPPVRALPFKQQRHPHRVAVPPLHFSRIRQAHIRALFTLTPSSGFFISHAGLDNRSPRPVQRSPDLLPVNTCLFTILACRSDHPVLFAPLDFAHGRCPFFKLIQINCLKIFPNTLYFLAFPLIPSRHFPHWFLLPQFPFYSMSPCFMGSLEVGDLKLKQTPKFHAGPCCCQLVIIPHCLHTCPTPISGP